MREKPKEETGFYKDISEASEGLIRQAVIDRQNLQRTETEDFLRAEISDYESRSSKYWKRDYNSMEAYKKSVEPNRKRWLEAVGEFEPGVEDMEPIIEPFWQTEHFVAKWINIKLFERLRGRAILAIPKVTKEKVPIVICQHGIGSGPENVFGFDDPDFSYAAYGKHLAEEGFAVLAPLNITERPPRARYTRMARLLGKDLWGLEIFKIRRLLDYALSLPEIDPELVAMWGLSLGGAFTLYTTPLELRIKVAIISGWFSHRIRKMIIDDPRQPSFISEPVEHQWISGLLREFTDSDLISLICPRPVMIQSGKCDTIITWWPFAMEEFERARAHYRKLGIEDRIKWDLHEAGHCARVQSGIEFLKKWLTS